MIPLIYLKSVYYFKEFDFYLYRKIPFVLFILEKHNTQPIPLVDPIPVSVFVSAARIVVGKDKKLSLRLG